MYVLEYPLAAVGISWAAVALFFHPTRAAGSGLRMACGKARQPACTIIRKRGCASISQAAQDLLFIWPEAGPMAAHRAEAHKLPLLPFLDEQVCPQPPSTASPA